MTCNVIIKTSGLPEVRNRSDIMFQGILSLIHRPVFVFQAVSGTCSASIHVRIYPERKDYEKNKDHMYVGSFN